MRRYVISGLLAAVVVLASLSMRRVSAAAEASTQWSSPASTIGFAPLPDRPVAVYAAKVKHVRAPLSLLIVPAMGSSPMPLATALPTPTLISIGSSPVPLPPPTQVAIGSSPVPLPPPTLVAIGSSPVPLPPPTLVAIGSSPVPLPPPTLVAIGSSPVPLPPPSVSLT